MSKMANKVKKRKVKKAYVCVVENTKVVSSFSGALVNTSHQLVERLAGKASQKPSKRSTKSSRIGRKARESGSSTSSSTMDSRTQAQLQRPR